MHQNNFASPGIVFLAVVGLLAASTDSTPCQEPPPRPNPSLDNKSRPAKPAVRAPAGQTRSPDHFELFFECAVDAPRGTGHVLKDRHYLPATSAGGYQPWWNAFAGRNKNLTAEEERLQRFWHDYSDGLKQYYGAPDHIDWVAYYKNHGYQVNAGCGGLNGQCCGSQRIPYAPVFVNPQMQWAIPNASPVPVPPVPTGSSRRLPNP